MEKYRNMTYTIRKDGRLMKKLSNNGKSEFIYARTPQELYSQYIEMNYKINANKFISKSDIKFNKYAEEWFEINISNKEIATQNSVKNRIKHINEYIGHIKLSDIKPNDIQKMVTGLQSRGFTDLTNRTLMECKRILENAVVNDYIEKNPANGISKIRYVKNERIPLTIEEDKKVLDLAFKHKYGLFILVLRYCGLRPEEAVALETVDVDLKNKRIFINKAVSLAQNQPILKATKTLKNRTVPIPDLIFEPLKERVMFCTDNQIKYIFTKESDNYSMWTKQALKTHLGTFLNALNKEAKEKIKSLTKELEKNPNNKRKIQKEIEIENNKIMSFTYYQLRHSYCTMLYYANLGVKEAQKLMGHSSAKMVYDIYTHLDSEKDNSTNSINTYLNKVVK